MEDPPTLIELTKKTAGMIGMFPIVKNELFHFFLPTLPIQNLLKEGQNHTPCSLSFSLVRLHIYRPTYEA